MSYVEVKALVKALQCRCRRSGISQSQYLSKSKLYLNFKFVSTYEGLQHVSVGIFLLLFAEYRYYFLYNDVKVTYVYFAIYKNFEKVTTKPQALTTRASEQTW